MGNKFTRRRAIVDEQYTRTQGLYQHRDLDPRKLRKLILSGQLAPCFPGVEEASPELDECPICFLFYPSLNRSKCCTKSICTECFLQIKSPHLAQPPQCPFCKTSSYVVEYRGAKSLEEKGVEQAEEQKVIEAKIRIRLNELQEEKERMSRREEGIVGDASDDAMRNIQTISTEQRQGLTVADALISDNQTSLSEPISGPQTTLQTSASGRSRYTSFNRSNRENDFDIDLEDIMVMEAIWLSIQEQSQMQQESDEPQQRTPEVSNNASAENLQATSSIMGGQGSNEPRAIAGRSSVQGGLVGAIAALAERQIGSLASLSTSDQNSNDIGSNCAPSDDNEGPEVSRNRPSLTLRGQLQRSAEMEQAEGMLKTSHSHSGSHELSTWIDDAGNGRSFSLHLQRENRGSDWLLDHSSEAVEVGTSFSSSVPSASELPWEAPDCIPSQGTDISSDLLLMNPTPVLPESYEEQIMLAMALSLADAQSQTRGS